MSTIKELNQIRIDIDVLIKMGDQLKNSRETSTAFTKLQEGRMHVGNALFELKGVTPYTDSKDPKTERIDPYFEPKDLAPKAEPEDWNTGTHTANVKIIRRELDEVLGRIRSLSIVPMFGDSFESVLYACEFKLAAYINLKEAQNWYGMELGRIRDERVQ